MFSLQTKCAALIAAFTALSVLAGDLQIRRSVARNLEAALTTQLSTFARHIEEQIDRDLHDLRRQLADAGREALRNLASPPAGHNPGAGSAAPPRSRQHAARGFRSRLWRAPPRSPLARALGGEDVPAWAQDSDLSYFDYGLLLIGPDGGLVDDSLDRAELKRTNFAATGYFRAARADAAGDGVVSPPFIAEMEPRQPLVMFAVPLRQEPKSPGAPGEFAGVLCGGMDLSKNTLLARYTDIPFGQGGVIALVTPEGNVVAHTDRRRVLSLSPSTPTEAEGRARWQSFDAGRPGLLVTRPLAAVDWRLHVWQPVDPMREAFMDGWRQARSRFLLWGAASVAAAWGLGAWLARDLARLARQVRGLGRRGYRPGRRVGPEDDSEAGDLARAINAMLAGLERARREVDQLATWLASAEERERRAIAVDLHDSVCQTLAVAHMELGKLRARLAAVPADAVTLDLVSRARERVNDGVRELRTLIFDLSPPILYELGLPAALAWLAEGFARRFGIPLRVEDRAGGREAPAAATEKTMFLYRAAREAAINAAKHAEATEITIRLSWSPEPPAPPDETEKSRPARGRWRVEIADNGRGFDPEAASAAGSGGFGLRTLRDRLGHLGGSLRIESAPGAGTRVFMEVPAHDAE